MLNFSILLQIRAIISVNDFKEVHNLGKQAHIPLIQNDTSKLPLYTVQSSKAFQKQHVSLSEDFQRSVWVNVQCPSMSPHRLA